jgi:oxygen-dependent protoporphyrinogen oxidase
VAAFAGRRFGDEAVARLIGPFLTGVYAGDERELGAEAVLGGLVEHERRFGSVAIGLLSAGLARRRERGLAGSFSALQGLGPFARRLAERLYDPPALGAQMVALARDGARWRVSVSSPSGESEMRTPRLVIATGAGEAAGFLRDTDSELADALAGIAYAPIIGIPVGVDPERVARKIEGFGFLVPGDQEIPLLGCLFMSQLFPGRAPAGREQALVVGRLAGRHRPVANRFNFVVFAEPVFTLVGPRQWRAPDISAIGIQRPHQAQVRQVGDTMVAGDTFGVFEKKQLSAMVAVEDLHI